MSPVFRSKNPRLMILLMAVGVILGLGAPAGAQYRLHSWESFEDGLLPPSLVRGHYADLATVNVIDLRQPGVPASVNQGVAALEVGRYGLVFTPVPTKQHLSVFSPVSLNRDALGTTGRALFQADFYFKAKGEPMPSMSLLAQVLNDEKKTTYRFYRFGYLEAEDRLFYSYVDDTPEPVDFQNEAASRLLFRRPGWHRFQIIFTGSDEIVCAVDGIPTKFSPIKQGKHRELNAGIMVTSSKFDSSAVTDNLSIQWSPAEAPIPASPWTTKVESVAVANASAVEAGESVLWLNDPAEVWNRASLQKRPILALFYTPNIQPYAYLKTIVPNTDEVHQLLNRNVLLRIDANQLNGNRLADKFRIARLPTLVRVGPDGTEMGRVTVINGQTKWEEIKALLDAGAGG